MPSLTLLPAPRELQFADGAYPLKANQRIVLQSERAGDLLFAAQRLQTALMQNAGVRWSLAATASGSADEIGVVLRVEPSRVTRAQGY